MRFYVKSSLQMRPVAEKYRLISTKDIQFALEDGDLKLMPRLLGLVMYCDDDKALTQLRHRLHADITYRAHQEGWHEEWERRLERFSEALLVNFFCMPMKANGDPVEPSGRLLSEWLSIDEAAYRKTWKGRLDSMGKELSQYRAVMHRHLAKKLKPQIECSKPKKAAPDTSAA